MDILEESPESKRFKPCFKDAESSIVSLNNLNLDCLEEIFKLLPFRDIVRLRFVSRSWNIALCQYLQTYRKLQIFLNVEEPFWFKNYEEVEHGNELKTEPIFKTLDPGKHPILLSDQSHFRFEDFVYMNSLIQESSGRNLKQKVDSLLLFMTNHMTNLTKLALLINHEDYLSSIEPLLRPLRNLKVLLIELTEPITQSYPATSIMDAISGLPELSSLYYLSTTSHRHHNPNQRLSSREDFAVVMLKRLRVFHPGGLVLPVGVEFEENVEELKLNFKQAQNAVQNRLSGLQRLTVWNASNGEFMNTFSRVQPCRVQNLRVLQMADKLVYDKNMAALNMLPNLEELHCKAISPQIQDLGWYEKQNFVKDKKMLIIEPNHTIVRLFTTYHNDHRKSDFYYNLYELSKITLEQMNEYTAFCKQYFSALKMMKNEKPEHFAEFH